MKQRKKQERKADHMVFSLVGVSVLGMGIVFTTAISPAFVAFLRLGAVLMTVGVVNGGKWPKPTDVAIERLTSGKESD